MGYLSVLRRPGSPSLALSIRKPKFCYWMMYVLAVLWDVKVSMMLTEDVYPQVLAALDVQTGKWIVDNCFMGDLVRGRTVILVVRNLDSHRVSLD